MTRRMHLNIEALEEKALLSAATVSLTTGQSVYQAGQSVHITFTETNKTTQPILIDYGPSNDGFAIEQGGNTVWRSYVGAIPMYLVADTLEPGHSLTLTATWNGVPNVGSLAKAADTGTFVVINQLDPSVTATFQITSSSPPSQPPTPTPISPPSPVSPPTPIGPTSPANPPSPSPTPTPTPSPIPPNPPAPTPISPPDPAPIVTTPVTTSSTGKHDHAVHRHAHHQAAKVVHIPQLAVKVHHLRQDVK